ncbi:MAG TPA: hypothetical protein VM432_02780 [Bdellovibrionales bacterium]|nr:hypothetical protein [Bdellovibrionales bacterium]
MTKDENKKWLNEYQAFLNAEKKPVSQDATTKVFARMSELINPSAWMVFFKVLGIHLAVGFLSLSVCHQFGMNPFGTESSLDNWFMAMWGHNACMIACGTLFLGASILTAGYFLSIEEVRALKRTEFLQALSLGAVSLAIFAVFGAELALAFAGLWLLGALVGGFAATQVVWKLKRI